MIFKSSICLPSIYLRIVLCLPIVVLIYLAVHQCHYSFAASFNKLKRWKTILLYCMKIKN